jgi:hypothetical protein
MKKALITTVALLGAAGAAFGWGKLVSSFRCPAGHINPVGVSCYGSNRVWISTADPDRIFECTPSGSVVRSFAGRTDGTGGLAVGNMSGTVFFWEVSDGTDRIYRRRATSGSTVRSWSTPRNLPVGAGFRQAGSAYYIYHTDWSGRLYRMSAAYGQLQTSYSLSYHPGDCAYGAGYLWITDPDGYAVWKCREDGVKYDVFSTVVWGRPYGIGYSAGYVWVGIGNPVNRILRFTATSGTDVAPASLGKVKAVFR